ncbi:hypothetical protein [Mycobacterium phage WXIN]|nr:hypothetical protein [Mycobacterium phage WXIN]
MQVKVYLGDDDKPDGSFWLGSAAYIARDLLRTYDVQSVLVMRQDSTRTVSYWTASGPAQGA